MFRTVGDQVSLWESMLPAELVVLPAELAQTAAGVGVIVAATPLQSTSLKQNVASLRVGVTFGSVVASNALYSR